VAAFRDNGHTETAPANPRFGIPNLAYGGLGLRRGSAKGGAAAA